MNALQTHEGKTWRDMPGADPLAKRMNFSLFKRDRLNRRILTEGHQQMLSRAGKSSAQGVVYAPDGEALKLRVLTVVELRQITLHAAVQEITRLTTGLGHGRLQDVVSGKDAMTERLAVWVRAWLEKNRTEEDEK